MFDNIRKSIGVQELPIKPIGEIMLSDDQNGLTDCEWTLIFTSKDALIQPS